MRTLFSFVAFAIVLTLLPPHASAAPTMKPAPNTHECYYHDALDGCTLSVTSDVNIYGCEDEGYYYNVHRVLLSQGLTYTFTLASIYSNYSPFIGVSHKDSSTYFVHATGSRGGSAVVTFTPPTGDYYEIFVGPAERVMTGSFRLVGKCLRDETPAGSCVATSTTACLLSNRFRVGITYRNQFANPPQNGTFLGAQLVPGIQNPDVATFGVSSPQAIEVVVRVQDVRPFANRFDVYYGGLTDLEYTVRVEDTVKGIVRTYRNPPGTVGGGVDRASFTTN